MLANLIGHWLIGLPFAAVVAFWFGWGVIGLWVGLSVGLTLVALALLVVWQRRLIEVRTTLAPPARGAATR